MILFLIFLVAFLLCGCILTRQKCYKCQSFVFHNNLSPCNGFPFCSENCMLETAHTRSWCCDALLRSTELNLTTSIQEFIPVHELARIIAEYSRECIPANAEIVPDTLDIKFVNGDEHHLVRCPKTEHLIEDSKSYTVTLKRALCGKQLDPWVQLVSLDKRWSKSGSGWVRTQDLFVVSRSDKSVTLK